MLPGAGAALCGHPLRGYLLDAVAETTDELAGPLICAFAASSWGTAAKGGPTRGRVRHLFRRHGDAGARALAEAWSTAQTAKHLDQRCRELGLLGWAKEAHVIDCTAGRLDRPDTVDIAARRILERGPLQAETGLESFLPGYDALVVARLLLDNATPSRSECVFAAMDALDAAMAAGGALAAGARALMAFATSPRKAAAELLETFTRQAWRSERKRGIRHALGTGTHRTALRALRVARRGSRPLREAARTTEQGLAAARLQEAWGHVRRLCLDRAALDAGNPAAVLCASAAGYAREAMDPVGVSAALLYLAQTSDYDLFGGGP